jgi:carbonic anhydrase/acetyltransferase-like protein (isoleucine patch superfamily)
VVVGSVKVGQDSSIWYGSTIRGDLNKINIGKNTVVQDRATIYPSQDKSVEIGDNVYIGPNTVLESCNIQNHGFVGMGASVRNGAKVESYGVVAAGGVIPENATVGSYQVRQFWLF